MAILVLLFFYINGPVASHRCPQETCLDDLFALHLDTLTWERVPHSAPWLCARESHSMAALPAAAGS
jgi:hypothetical protein